MAASKKRRVAEGEDEENSDYTNSDSDEMNVDNAVDMEEVQVDFEATTPNDSDFHGIKRLLQQLFLKAHVNLSELTNLLIQQNFVSSVIKQSEPDDISEDDSEEEESFGVSSVVNITAKRDVECVKQIRSLLLEHCKSTCSAEDFEKFKKILEDPEKHVGLILSERFLNIPPQISLPLYESLSNDMKKAKEEKKQFDFAYYLLICKIYTDKDGTANNGKETEYANAEEELFEEEAHIKFDYSVSGEQDTGLGGKWTDDDEEWQRHRRILLFPATKWDVLMEKLRAELSTNYSNVEA